MSQTKLKIINARENNLKGVTVELPHDQLIVATGISGSGKSSLAFDTIYAEGQRRYIETFSPYTRQFFDKVKKPSADSITGSRPAVAIQQRTRVTGSRSTVGSITNINDYLKILWTNLASPYCPNCASPLKRWSAKEIAEDIKARSQKNPEAGFVICARYKIEAKQQAAIERLETLGFSRVFDLASSEILSLSEIPAIDLDTELILVIDRVRGRSASINRIKDSIDQAFMLAHGSCMAIEVSANPAKQRPNIISYHSHYSCSTPSCLDKKIAVAPLRPALFTYNHPIGACPRCHGFGNILTVDLAACIPNPTKSISEHAIQCWSGKASGEFRRLLRYCQKAGIATDTPWKDLKPEHQQAIVTNGSRDYRGITEWFEKLARKSYKMHVRVFLSRYRKQVECPDCSGTRLKQDALAYRIDGSTIADLWKLPISQALDWVSEIYTEHSKKGDPIREIVLPIRSRLQYLVDLGLPYLTLDRTTRSLSGGETQRVNLAAALGSELVSTQFVLDEPSVGLHPRDTARLIAAITELKNNGNSVLVVEHDQECIAAADQIIEMGPAAGEHGGEITYQGSYANWKPPALALADTRLSRPEFSKNSLSISGATVRNLKIDNLNIPLDCVTCLTGVSGSGKSTLAHEVIMRAYQAQLNGITSTLPFNVTGFEQLSKILSVDQSPLAKSPRSNIATYSGIWDVIRDRFARTELAKQLKLTKSHFSFNVDGGRCPACKGAGHTREDMQFLSDIYVQCELCLGKRFGAAVLEVALNGMNVDALLSSTVNRCYALFADEPKISGPLKFLIQLGLGHITLGHPLSELSGGEAQRLKLVPALSEGSSSKVLFVFDEPTTGLHFNDVLNLSKLFDWLVGRGHSVLCIEHNLLLISRADWMIDLGPEGGASGGRVLVQGRPLELIEGKHSKNNHTLSYLKNFISNSKLGRKSGGKLAEPVHAKTLEQAKFLTIKGAKEHNLKNIDLALPLNTFIAITGVSGSGKSTIAKDIIYAEGQRRYLDCLSPYARQFIKELSKPAIDGIYNVQPTVCVYQHTFQPSALSTVGTMSEVYNFLRLLYAKCGIQHCPNHPEQIIAPLAPSEICQQILSLKTPNVKILAPRVRSKKGYHREIFRAALEEEVFQVRVDGKFGKTSDFLEGLERSKPHTIELVIASFNPANLDQELLLEPVQQALSLGGGSLVIHFDGRDYIYSVARTCPECKTGFFKPDPEDLSFSSKRGRCKKCDGTGRTHADSGQTGSVCTTCNGTRLSALAQNIRFGGLNISELCKLTPGEIAQFLSAVEVRASQKEIVAALETELHARLATLVEFGLGYLTLDRACNSLSGGELQRLRLAAAIGSPLSGVTYIFDEPTAGLHPSETAAILTRLKTLTELGNTVLMIEHDIQSIRAADQVIEIGPGAGINGGEVVFSGAPDELLLTGPDSATARALVDPPILGSRDKSSSSGWLEISSTQFNNLKKERVKLPLQALTVVCGVSGAGKSSLINGVMLEAFENSHVIKRKAQQTSWNGTNGKVSSAIPISRIIEVDQKPIGVNARSTPASYLGVWDEIRKLFSNSIEAKTRGFGPGYFSYNTGKGRCSECKGQGEITIEMNFLPDAKVICEQCGGRRFSNDAEEIKYQGSSVADVLSWSFEEARSKFANHRKIHQVLHVACELGLGYLTIGQSSATLSGGESQRIKLVTELTSRPQQHSLYVLDEPTSGLHRYDIKLLLKALRDLVNLGHTVVVVEHDPDLVASADYLIEMGPGPAQLGGRVIFHGTPITLLESSTPWSSALNEYLKRFGIQSSKAPEAKEDSQGELQSWAG